MLLQTIRDALTQVDPEGFLALGAPVDEYDAEAMMIAERLDQLYEIGYNDVYETIVEVWREMFGHPDPEEYEPPPDLTHLAQTIWSSSELAGLS